MVRSLPEILLEKSKIRVCLIVSKARFYFSFVKESFVYRRRLKKKGRKYSITMFDSIYTSENFYFNTCIIVRTKYELACHNVYCDEERQNT